MPYLRIFDINHRNCMENNNLTYHDLINQFNSSFWIKKNWFFTHQHDWIKRLDTGIIYSTGPYRRNDYDFYWEIDEYNCSHFQEINLNLVQHLSINSKQIINIYLNYFPNVTHLTINHYFQTSDKSIITTLNHLQQCCSLNEIQLIVNLFPQLDYLKTRMNRKEIRQITKYLLSKTNDKTQHLFFLCISQIPKVCLKELNILIKSENLLDNYLIKFINRDLYLWW
ncbi:unnamed protein product [Rotaria sp. Silwood1]|nr:unnamed protein product [Rotaria sp. Silwood1]